MWQQEMKQLRRHKEQMKAETDLAATYIPLELRAGAEAKKGSLEEEVWVGGASTRGPRKMREVLAHTYT